MNNPIILRKVSWSTIWNTSTAAHCDGYGSAIHLTAETGKSGKTLCGKEFPVKKGWPSTWKICKRCVNKAYKMGFEPGFTKTLETVE